MKPGNGNGLGSTRTGLMSHDGNRYRYRNGRHPSEVSIPIQITIATDKTDADAGPPRDPSTQNDNFSLGLDTFTLNP